MPEISIDDQIACVRASCACALIRSSALIGNGKMTEA